jgi:predicted nuclease with TOPRIM domain
MKKQKDPEAAESPTLAKKLRDAKRYLREANRGAERQSILAQLMTMRLNKSQREIYELNQKVRELETKLEYASAWISQIFRDLGLPEGDMGALELYIQANAELCQPEGEKKA